ITILVCSLFVFPLLSDAAALWEEDGNPVVTGAPEEFWFPEICGDGEGGAIAAWNDSRSGYANLYAQRIDSYGHRLWTPGGVALSALPYTQAYHRIIADGEGGAIVVWINDIYGSIDVYAQRIDGEGNLLWGSTGVAVCTASGMQYESDLVSDGVGGAIFAWADMRGVDPDIYAQRIDAGGTALWTAGGVAVSAASGTQEEPRLASNNNGGAIIVWEDNRGSDQDIYARQVGADGSVFWLGEGLPICVMTGWQEYPRITSDGAGGAIIAWADPRGTYSSIYAQRFDRDGYVRWSANGILVSDSLAIQYDVNLIPDGSGGVFLAWEGGLGGSFARITAQRISSAGGLPWGYGGIDFFETEWETEEPVLVSDGEGGIIVAWADERTGNWNVYAERLNDIGESYWPYGGVVLCDAFGDQTKVRIVSDGAGGAIASYQDQRTGYREVYAQRVTAGGFWGYPCPEIYSVHDVPGDEGGQVNLAWYAGRLDYDPDYIVSHYSIWRAIEEAAAMSSVRNGALMLAGAHDISLGAPPGTIRTGELLGEPYFWQLVETVAAGRIETYAETVPTLFDSTAVSTDYHYFQIIAHTEDPLLFWTSEPDSGYSLDNLSPCPPLGLAGEQQHLPEGLRIFWDPNAEPDLDGYAVYRGLTEDFEPGPGNMLATPCDTFTFDGDWRWDSGYYYKVAAADIHGNESPYALLRPYNVTGGDTPEAPLAFFLDQNVPNPFNPSTTIRYFLPERCRVTLQIYDIAGRRIACLVDRMQDRGQHHIVWNGTDMNGDPAGSGVYLYRLTAGKESISRKMILLR
ncbi:MAG TPA: T9SS type A sorting domain-containing protein, partial [Patescibacteria group bacterium]|nr:T9SS type A sorting domain-containing protein [Patescibacteria group bacterium]